MATSVGSVRASSAWHLLAAPTVFVALIALPFDALEYPVRGGIGLLIWMSWWWVSRCVHLAVTGFLPLVVLALFDFLPVTSILPAYAQQLVILLIGANVLATLWARWGLDRRIALFSLLGLGSSTRQQILAWFMIATVLSAILPNTVVAAAMMPIVVAMLRYIGIEDIGRSAFGSALLIAVAWGTSVGGAATPIGGAPNLLTIQFIERELIDHEFLFTTWLSHLLPLTIVTGAVAFVFMRFALKPELDRVDGTRAYFKGCLAELGPLSVPERWGLGLFLAALLLAFTRQLYDAWLPGLTPAFAFLTCGIAAFVVRHRGEPILSWEFAQSRMIWGLIYLFAGGSALGQILSDTGTAQFIAAQITPLAAGGGLFAVLAFTLLTVVLTQVTSNTAAIAIVVPITISTFQGLGLDPLPMVFIVAAAGNYGLMLPSSSGGPAIAAGYGVDLRVMLTSGAWLTVMILVSLVLGGYLLTTFWPGFGAA